MRRRSKVISLALVGIAVSIAACQPPPPQPPPDTRAADEAALRARDAEWSKGAAAKDAAGFASFFADAGVLMPPNSPALTGRDAVQKWATELMANPGFAVSWTATHAEAARSGDLGYTCGTYELTLHDAKGKPATDLGKYATVWKKQADGSWQVAADIFNTGQ